MTVDHGSIRLPHRHDGSSHFRPDAGRDRPGTTIAPDGTGAAVGSVTKTATPFVRSSDSRHRPFDGATGEGDQPLQR